MSFVSKVQEIFNEIRHHPKMKRVRKLIVFVFGITILLIGIVMIIAPGPALIVIPLSLAILGTEFLWAKRLLNKMKDQVTHLRGKVPFKINKDLKNISDISLDKTDDKKK